MGGIKNLSIIDGKHLRGASVASIDLAALNEPSVLVVTDAEQQMMTEKTLLVEDASNLFAAKQILMETVLTAVLPVAAEMLVNAIPEGILETVINNNCENMAPLSFLPSPTAVLDVLAVPHEVVQPLGDLLMKHAVHVPAGVDMKEEDITKSIEELDKLILLLQSLDPSEASLGRSPGFETRVNGNNFCWVDTHKTKTPYQVLTSLNNTKDATVPQPSPSLTLKYLLNIKTAWEERRNYVRESHFGEAAEQQFCSCIREWGHSTGDVLVQIANQSLEQVRYQ